MIESQVKQILVDTLNLGGRVAGMTATTPLLGALPELDSMAVVALIGKLEERFDIAVMDDEITADTFATLGSLVQFVEGKRSA